MNYFLEHKLKSIDNSAFSSNHNIQTALYTVINDMFQNMVDDILTEVCTLDIKKVVVFSL